MMKTQVQQAGNAFYLIETMPFLWARNQMMSSEMYQLQCKAKAQKTKPNHWHFHTTG